MNAYDTYRLALKNGLASPVRKEKKPIAKMSSKRQSEQVQYRKLVSEMMKVSDRCEIRSPECTGKAQGMQHVKRRGKNLLNKKYLKRACNPCNGYCEKFPQWALDNGHAISVHKKDAA